MKKLNYLVLVRHGQSEWNKKNLFTGWSDPDLTEEGIQEATKAGKLIGKKNIKFDFLFTSVLTRAIHTGNIILKLIHQEALKVFRDKALNERNYGDLVGLNKDDARRKWGDELVHIWRRSYDTPPPGGESLKQTGQRVMPYYNQNIVPKIKKGQNILVTAHGNSLRSLIKELDVLNDEEIVKLEIPTGVPIIYTFDDSNNLIKKEILNL
tara:strand:- start:10670 stop:11296 length:627 start_codon:yes stop_codon:yes gene_type:complete